MQNKYNTFPDDKMKCGIVVLENTTGNILALCGNRESGMKNLNYATEVYNQPGSTIKPILSYAPAFEYLNYVPLTQILDEPYTYPDGNSVKNWDNRFLGNISLRVALSDSRNIPAIKLYKNLNDKSWILANKLGLKNRDGYIHESQAIGGFERGFSVLEMANAYLAFANMGKFIKASAISSIKTTNETIINNNTFETVMSEETAFLINDILHDVLKNTNYDLKHTFLSTKTGQSNYDLKTRIKYNIPQNSTKDSWVISYTPDLTIAIWCGYDNMEGYLTPKTKNIPLKIMNQFLNEFAKPNLKYDKPNELKWLSVDVRNGLLYETKGYNYDIKRDYFYDGFIPLSKENLDYQIV
jgi:penicillin-binding protein 1A